MNFVLTGISTAKATMAAYRAVKALDQTALYSLPGWTGEKRGQGERLNGYVAVRSHGDNRELTAIARKAVSA
jgi:hypothetical protein